MTSSPISAAEIASLKPLVIYGKGGPNPPKVALVALELGIPHTIIDTQFAEVKTPAFLAINPNGRIPALHDPNTDLTIWESGAILDYLVTHYDPLHKLSFPLLSNEAALAKQWLYFQVSGQGPYYGQGVWFLRYHGEKIPSAVKRYMDEAKRVTRVLEDHLVKEKEKYAAKGELGDGPWLVGGRISYADISFWPWQDLFETYMKDEGFDHTEFPEVLAWLDRMRGRESFKKVFPSGRLA